MCKRLLLVHWKHCWNFSKSPKFLYVDCKFESCQIVTCNVVVTAVLWSEHWTSTQERCDESISYVGT